MILNKMNKEEFIELHTNFNTEQVCLGIDEAGRGPVIGPMVYACCYWAKSNEDRIKKYFKFDDSKKLKDETREKIFNEMKNFLNILNYDTVIISPEDLSRDMLLRNKKSLNVISTDAACKLINNSLDKGVNITHVYVDTVGDPGKYEQMLRDRFIHKKIEFKVTAKADSLFPVVSAASIVAKVTRDRCVMNWKFKENISTLAQELFNNDYNSGYPSDPNSVQWMENNFEPVFIYPSIVRFSWKTVTNYIKTKGGKQVRWENYEDDEGKTRSVFKAETENQKLDSFAKGKNTYDFFRQNEISLTGFTF